MRRYKSNCKFSTEMIQIGSFLVFFTIYVLKSINFAFLKKMVGNVGLTLARLKRLCGGE